HRRPGLARRVRGRLAHGAPGVRATRLKETWRRFSPAQVRDFLRVGHEGRDHPSRLKAVELLAGMSSVLDVGCGPGVIFELIREKRPDLDYLGIDVTAQFVAAARERFPAEAARFRESSLYDLTACPASSTPCCAGTSSSTCPITRRRCSGCT